MKYSLIFIIVLLIIFGIEFVIKVKNLDGNFTKKIKSSLIFRINLMIVLSIVIFILFIINFNRNKYDYVKDGYVAVFHGGSGEVTYSTYIYKVDNGQANMGFEYINTVNSSKSWGSSEWNVRVISSGEFDFTDGAFIIAKKHGAYDYVIDGYTNERFTIEEFQGKFLMN